MFIPHQYHHPFFFLFFYTHNAQQEDDINDHHYFLFSFVVFFFVLVDVLFMYTILYFSVQTISLLLQTLFKNIRILV